MNGKEFFDKNKKSATRHKVKLIKQNVNLTFHGR